MTSQPSHYDESLLASAPIATKEQLQEGYNADILTANRKAAPSPPTPLRHAEAGLPSKEYVPLAPVRLPFWRTTKGRIVIAVAVIIVIAAVVGGAVGGSKKKGSNPLSGQTQPGAPNNNVTTVTSTGQPISQNTVGPVATPTTPTTPTTSTPVQDALPPPASHFIIPTQTASAEQLDFTPFPFP